MKKEIVLIVFCMLFLVSGVLGATCTYFGEEIPCDEMPTWVWVMPIVIFGFLFVFGILFAIFWIWMLIDAVKYCNDDEKIVWIIVIVLANWIGALIYFFVVRRKRRRLEKVK